MRRASWSAHGQFVQLGVAGAPLVLWSLSHGASSMPAFANGSHYAIHVLAADQKPWPNALPRAALTAGPAWNIAPASTAPHCWPVPLPRLNASTGQPVQRGDHTIFVGEVERCEHREGASPLLYHGGKFYTEHPL